MEKDARPCSDYLNIRTMEFIIMIQIKFFNFLLQFNSKWLYRIFVIRQFLTSDFQWAETSKPSPANIKFNLIAIIHFLEEIKRFLNNNSLCRDIWCKNQLYNASSTSGKSASLIVFFSSFRALFQWRILIKEYPFSSSWYRL